MLTSNETKTIIKKKKESNKKQIRDIVFVACRETLFGRLEDEANGHFFLFLTYDHLFCILKKSSFVRV